MCGIAGVLSKQGQSTSLQVLHDMGVAQAHRGPDGSGEWSEGPIGLSHRRLAIIDLSNDARQPMHSGDGSVTISFNGEVYNFQELRSELEARGVTFRTRSDTEVIIAAWQMWGTACVARLDGMFAFALWDSTKRTLLLARDRTGKKPLYVYEDDARLVFGSEQKAVFAVPGLDRSVNHEAIPQFLTHGYVPTPGSFYRRVRTVEPATWELHSLEKATQVARYWSFPTHVETSAGSDEEVSRRVRELFFAAVKRRLVSNVPLGAFLSGGIDSTLVVAAMAQLSGKVKTFSIGFEGPVEWDETSWAAQVARRYDTDHTEFRVKPDSFQLIEKLAWHYDEPFGDSSAIPSFVVSSLTRQKVTVSLTGDGGDELFAGYPRFAAATWSERVPSLFRGFAAQVIRSAPRGSRHDSRRERAHRVGVQLGLDLPDRLRGWLTFFTPAELRRVLRPEFAALATDDRLGERYWQTYRECNTPDVLNRVLCINARTYLLDDLNVKMDRASMAASLETRAPFLDTDLMNYVFALPARFKLRGRETKWLLKHALGDLMPEGIATRRKMGFGVPLGAWFRGPLRERLREVLLANGAPLHDYVERDELEVLLKSHESRRRDWGHQFWCLWMLDLWLRRERSV